MIAIIIIVCIIIFIVVSLNINSNPTSTSKSQRIVDEINRNRETDAQRNARFDKMYLDYYNRHKSKTKNQIWDYIESHRKGNDPYWGSNKIEYRALMSLLREIEELEKNNKV